MLWKCHQERGFYRCKNHQIYLGSCLINKHTIPSNLVCYLHFICSQFTWETTTNHLCCVLQIPASVLAKSELSFNNEQHNSSIPTALKSLSPPRSPSRLYHVAILYQAVTLTGTSQADVFRLYFFQQFEIMFSEILIHVICNIQQAFG